MSAVTLYPWRYHIVLSLRRDKFKLMSSNVVPRNKNKKSVESGRIEKSHLEPATQE